MIGRITFQGWARLSVFYLVLVALWGCALRALPFLESFPFEFRHLLHAHSHVAMLGWVFNMLLMGIVKEFLSPSWMEKKVFLWSFWLIQLCVFGMLISFSLEGYALWSITFSTLHILVSYVLIAAIVKSAGLFSGNSGYAGKFLLAGLFFLFLSSFGPLGLAVTSAKGLAGTPIYKASIYFFLHFTYNGWMTMALLAIWLRVFDRLRFQLISYRLRWGFWLLAFSILATYLMSLYEFGLDVFWNYLGLVLGIIQLAGFFLVGAAMKKIDLMSGKLSTGTKVLLLFSASSLFLKAVLQIASAFPAMESLAFFTRDLIVLYLHLVFLGWVSVALFAYLAHKYKGMSRIFYWGTGIFILGFAFQEIVLYMRGTLLLPGAMYEMTTMLLIAGIVLLIGSCFLLGALLVPARNIDGQGQLN